jgi:antitoxin PrlF
MSSCCNKNEVCTPLESIVNVDERGQLVLPKEIRDRWGLKGGDKLAILTSIKNGEICCVAMVKADLLTKNFKLEFDWIHEESSKQNTHQ